jgi:hypothetical protein
MNGAQRKRGSWSWWYLLFEPTLMGIPFFYWFQLFWVIVSAVFTGVVYFVTDD